MSAKQLSTKLSTVLSEVLASSLKSESDRNKVLEAWNNRKDVTKLLNNSSKPKVRKDPNAPKKAVTSYICFCNEQRQAVRQKNPNMAITEIAGVLGTMWKALSEKEKAKYEKQAQQDKVRYENEMKSYTPPEGTEVQTRGRGARKERTGPRKAMSAYMYFGQEMRPKLKSQVSHKEMMGEIGRLWKELSPEQRAPYEQRALEDKQRYETEKNGGTTSSSTTRAAPVNATTSSSGKGKGKTSTPQAPAPAQTTSSQPAPSGKRGKGKKEETKQVAPSAPASSAPSGKGGRKEKVSTDTPGFESFSNERRSELEDEHPTWSIKKMDAELVKEWTAMDPQEREAYETEAREEDIEEELEDD